jgi:hypothetical protein
MNPLEIANMLYSILVFLAAIFGALNLHLYLKNRTVSKECKRLEFENEVLKTQLAECENDNRKS